MWTFDVEMGIGVPAPLEPPRQEAIPTILPPTPLPQHDSQESEMRGQMCARESTELSGLKSAGLLDAGHARLLVLGNFIFVNAKHFKMLGRRVATAEVVKCGVEVYHDTRTLEPCSTSSSMDPNPKRFKPITVTELEALAHQMDQDTCDLTSVGS